MKDKINLKKEDVANTKESIPTFDDQEVLDLLQDKVSTADTKYRGNKEIYERLENLYFGNVAQDSPTKNLETNMSSGQAYQITETITPRLTAGKIRVDLTATKAKDSQNARQHSKLLNLQIESDHLEEQFEGWIRQAVKTLGAIKVDFTLEEIKFTRKKKKYEMKIPMTNKIVGVGETIEVEEQEMVFKHDLQLISYEDLIIPEANNYKDLPFIGMKVIKQIFKLKEDDRYKNLDDLESYVINEAEKGNDNEFDIARDNQQDLDTDTVKSYALDKNLEIYEIYYWKEGHLYVVEYHDASGIVVRNEPLYYWHQMLPIRPLSLIPVENQVIGLSPLQTVEDDIDTLDIWLNVMLTTGLFDIQRPVVFDPRQTGVDWQKNPPVYKAGMSYPMKDAGRTFNILPAPTITPSHLQMYGIIKQTIQNVSGVTDYITGSEQIGEDKTLGEVKLKTAQSNKRFEGIVKGVRRALSDVLTMMVSNNQQYLPDEYEVRIFGDQGESFERFSPESIQGKFDVKIKGFEDIFVNEAEKVNKYQAMIADALKINQATGKPTIDIDYLSSQLYSEGYNVDEIDKVIIPTKDVERQKDGGKMDEAKRADAENKNPKTAILRPDEDMAVHLDVHEVFIKSPAFKKLSRNDQMILAKHVGNTRKAMAGKQENAQPQEGVVPSGRPASKQPPMMQQPPQQQPQQPPMMQQ